MRDVSFPQFLRQYFRQIILVLLVIANLIIYRDSEFIRAFDNVTILGTIILTALATASISFRLDEWRERRKRLA